MAFENTSAAVIGVTIAEKTPTLDGQ